MRVRLASGTRVLDGGRLLVGGSPLTVQRLRRPVTTTGSETTLGRRWLDTGLGVPVLEDAPRAAPDQLTVVVPARGRGDRVARCVEGLAPLRVLLIDDASHPPLVGAVVRLKRNRGPAAARNAGLRQVETPYVAFVDSDVTATAADLLALTRHFEDPTVTLVAPRVRGTAGGRVDDQRWWQLYDVAFNPLDLGPNPAPVRVGCAISYLPAACMLARTAALGPGFDASLRMGEDVDLIWRLVGSGHGVRYDPTVVVGHDTRPTLSAWLRQHFDYGTGAAALASRHGLAVAPAVLPVGLGTAAVLLLARVPWAGPMSVAAWLATVGRLTRVLPLREAGWIAAQGYVTTLRQEASLALRHWWPVSLVAVTHRRGRRLLVSALVVDTAIALTDRRGTGPLTLLAGRRLTDLAYGTGVWVGAFRARSPRALRVRLLRLGNLSSRWPRGIRRCLGSRSRSG